MSLEVTPGSTLPKRTEGTLTSKEADRVDVLSAAYQHMAKRWPLLDMLRKGGTQELRNESQQWLPRMDMETQQAYTDRVSRSYLFMAYDSAIATAVAQPFSKAVTVKGNLSERLAPIEKDADRQGTTLSKFAENLYEDAVDRGITHLLVDFPEFGRELNLRQELENEVRPYFTHLPAANLIGWTYREAINGGLEITSVRILEEREEAKGKYGRVPADYIRVVTFVYESDIERAKALGVDVPKGTMQLHKRAAGEEEFLPEEEERTHDFVGCNLVTLYTNQVGLLVGEPPLWKLAELNLKHAQCDSDHQNILHYTSIPMLFAAGFEEEQVDEGVEIGPRRMISTTNPQAKVSYVEHNGTAISSGTKNIDKIEMQMVSLGMEPFVEKVAKQTAKGQEIDSQKTTSDAKRWVRATEGALLSALKIAAKWVEEELDEDVKVEIYDDFGALSRAAEEVKDLNFARKNKDIDQETYLAELKKRQRISEDADIDAIIAKTESEKENSASEMNALLGIGDEDEEETETEDED